MRSFNLLPKVIKCKTVLGEPEVQCGEAELELAETDMIGRDMIGGCPSQQKTKVAYGRHIAVDMLKAMLPIG